MPIDIAGETKNYPVLLLGLGYSITDWKQKGH